VSRLGSLALLGAVALLAACGDDATSTPDAGLPDAGDVVVPPAAPNFGTCPTGWRESIDDVTHCEPWPETGPATCGATEMHLPGTPGCAKVGEACPPAGEWPLGLPTDVPILFVRAGATPGGDGSASAPLDSVLAALGTATAGSVVVLDGTFDETLIVTRAIELRGTCPSRAQLAPSIAGGATAAALTIRAAGVSVRDLAIKGARGGVRAESGGMGTLRGLAIEGATGIGLSVANGSALTTDGVLVRGTRPNAGRFGVGALVEDGGALTLARTAVEASVSAGVLTLGGALSLNDVVIRDTEAEPGGDVGNGLAVLGGVTAEGDRVVLERNRDASAMVVEASRLVLRDSVIRDTRPLALDSSAGRGLYVIEGSSAELDRVLLSGHLETGVLASDPGSAIVLRDTVVRDTEGRASDGYGGSAIAAQSSASVTLERVMLLRSRGTGVIVSSAATMTLTDVLVRDTRGFASDELKGTGLHAQRGGVITGSRVAVLANREVGILAIEGGSRVELSDVQVAGTQQRECALTTCPDVTFGDGLVSAIDAQIVLTRFVVADNARVGALVGGGSIDLHTGRVSGNPIGANIQTPAFDVLRLSDGVVFTGNGRNLDTNLLPVPSSAF
jgi:hypothetical protein